MSVQRKGSEVGESDGIAHGVVLDAEDTVRDGVVHPKSALAVRGCDHPIPLPAIWTEASLPLMTLIPS